MTVTATAFRRRLGLAAALLAAGMLLGACSYPTGTPQNFGPQANKLGVERTLYRHTVDFGAESAELAGGERVALDRFLAESGADRNATVLVTAAPTADGLSETRRLAVVRELRARGFDPRSSDPLLDRHPSSASDVIVRIARYHVVLPECPNYGRTMTGDNSNLPSSNFGCANRRNLGLMVANPRDLLRGRDMGPVAGERLARPVELYRQGKSYTPIVPGDGVGADAAASGESAQGDFNPKE